MFVVIQIYLPTLVISMYMSINAIFAELQYGPMDGSENCTRQDQVMTETAGGEKCQDCMHF